ncbi:MAG: PilZ domain-containing protein [Deltaproteobacteria bacterium]|nr:PilZ domain-containing protein [Deltaproteobacteria bacterium]
MSENRRRRTRINLRTKVDLSTMGAKLCDVQSRDLSHKGVYLEGNLPLSEGQSCYLTIHLFGEGVEVPDLHMEGKVIRVTPQGCAVDFVSMDPDTYMHLRNLVLFHAEDPESAEREFATPAFDYKSETD